MAKKRHPEQVLYDNLMLMPENTWFSVKKKEDTPADTELRVTRIKSFIDMGADFEFSNDYKKVRRLFPFFEHGAVEILWEMVEGYRFEEKLCPKDKYGKQAKYREIYINDKLVSIASI